MNARINTYKFADSKRGLLTVSILHIMLFGLLILPVNTPLLGFGRPQFCLLIALGSYALYRNYNWSNRSQNVLWLILYGCTLAAEWRLFGIPEPIVKSPVGIVASKGFLVDIFLNLSPLVYVGIRLMGIIFFALVARAASLARVDADLAT